MLYRLWKRFWARRRVENAAGAEALQWLAATHPGEVALDCRLIATEPGRRVYLLSLSPVGRKPTSPGDRTVAVDDQKVVVELSEAEAARYQKG
jgi:hypothetical protein